MIADILDNYRGMHLLMFRRDVDDKYLVGFQGSIDDNARSSEVWPCTFSLDADLSQAIHESVGKLNELLREI